MAVRHAVADDADEVRALRYLPRPMDVRSAPATEAFRFAASDSAPSLARAIDLVRTCWIGYCAYDRLG